MYGINTRLTLWRFFLDASLETVGMGANRSVKYNLQIHHRRSIRLKGND